MPVWFQSVMSSLGYTKKDVAEKALRDEKATASKQEALEQERHQRLAQQLEIIRAESNGFRVGLEAANRWKMRHVWQDATLAALPSCPAVPEEFYRKTLRFARSFAPEAMTLIDLSRAESFGRKEDARVFYWALAHSSCVAHRVARNLKDEDAISGEFLNALATQIHQQSTAGAEASLEIGLGAIYDNVQPALKEARVGADMLLIVSGNTLVPSGGARLFWLQAKRGTRSNPYILDYYREPNVSGVTQCDALARVHQPKLGSFGVYALYSDQLPFVSSIFVSESLRENSHVKRLCSISLAKDGARLQELIVAAAGHSQFGQFESADALLEYLDHASRASIVPLRVVSVHAGEELIDRKRLVQLVKAHYDERIRQSSQTQDRDRDQNQDFDIVR